MPGHLLVSLDLELHWGLRDHSPLDEDLRTRMMGTRAAIPRIVEVLVERDIRATWATVGFLLADGRDDLRAFLPRCRPAYRDPRLDPYAELDGLGDSEQDDPVHFAPSLIRGVAAAPGQEIGTHTLSHYYTLEPGQELDAFAADLRAARALHERAGLPFRSLVFPRNQFTAAHVEVAAGTGIVAFRGASEGRMYRPAPSGAEGPVRRAARLLDAYLPLTGRNVRAPAPWTSARVVDLPSSRFLRPHSRALAGLDDLALRRITADMSAAARAGGDYHLWWHPHNFGVDLDANLDRLRRVLDHAVTLRDRAGLRSVTMAERAEAVLTAREAA